MSWRRPPLRHHRLQTVLAVSAIAASVSLPVVLLSVGGGVSAHELAQLEDAGYEIVVSAPGVHGINQVHGLAASIDRLPEVGAASPVLSEAIDAFVGAGTGPRPVLVEGVVPGPFQATEGPTERALFPSVLPLGDPTDATHFANGSYRGTATWSVLVSTPFVQSSGVRVGESVVLSPTTDRGAGIAFNVTGVFGVPPSTLGPTAAYGLVVPLSDLQVVEGLAGSGSGGPPLDAADTVQVALAGSAARDPAAIDRTAAAIQGLVPYYGVSPLTDQAEQLRAASSVLTGFYLALSSVGLGVGLLFLALVLVRRVESERRTIGVQRALGVPGRVIARSIMAAGLLLASLGAIVGVAVGVLLILALRRLGAPEVVIAANLATFDPVTFLLLGIAVVGLSFVASGVATRVALRVAIPEALR